MKILKRKNTLEQLVDAVTDSLEVPGGSNPSCRARARRSKRVC